jgi:hypothetical protein
MATVLVSVDAAVVESVAVVVVEGGTGAGVGTGALAGAGTSSSEARNLASAFRVCSGNGPDRVLAQCSSMRASCVSIFSTVFKSSSVSASNAAGFVCAGVVVVGVVVGVEVVVGVGIFCEASASRITNAARIFAIVFRILSGNGPDRFIFHSSSIRRSLASHCATVLRDIAGGCGCVEICCVVRAVCVNGALNG